MTGSHRWAWAMGVGVAVMSSGMTPGQVIITEIMYNPASTEGGGKPKEGQTGPNVTRAEWVEISNTSDAEVDLSGWALKNKNGSTEALPPGAALPAGGVAVIVPSTITAEDFAAAWGEGLTVWPVGKWEKGGLRNLGNNPKEGDTLELVDAQGTAVDAVPYSTKGDWPRASNGPSIYLVREAYDAAANDQGSNWRRSTEGYNGAKTVTATEAFDGADVGSPGTLAELGAAEPEKPKKPKKKPAETDGEESPGATEPEAEPGME